MPRLGKVLVCGFAATPLAYSDDSVNLLQLSLSLASVSLDSSSLHLPLSIIGVRANLQTRLAKNKPKWKSKEGSEFSQLEIYRPEEERRVVAMQNWMGIQMYSLKYALSLKVSYEVSYEY